MSYNSLDSDNQSPSLHHRLNENEKNYRKFALKLLKKIIYPHNEDFILKNEVEASVRSVYHKNVYGECIYDRYIWATHWFENCHLDIFDLKFDRSTSHACTAKRCTLKISGKVTTSEKLTTSWKIGAKSSIAFKVKSIVTGVQETEASTALEVMSEYVEGAEKTIANENLVETTIELERGQIGIPTIVVAGVRCELAFLRLNYTRNLDMSQPPYSDWHVVEKLEPCEESSHGKDFDVLPDPFATRDIIIPLRDVNGEVTKIKFIQVLSFDNNNNK